LSSGVRGGQQHAITGDGRCAARLPRRPPPAGAGRPQRRRRSCLRRLHDPRQRDPRLAGGTAHAEPPLGRRGLLYSRNREMGAALSAADEVVALDVFAGNEAGQDDGSVSGKLVSDAVADPPALFAGTPQAARRHLESRLGDGDACVVLGVGAVPRAVAPSTRRGKLLQNAQDAALVGFEELKAGVGGRTRQCVGPRGASSRPGGSGWPISGRCHSVLACPPWSLACPARKPFHQAEIPADGFRFRKSGYRR